MALQRDIESTGDSERKYKGNGKLTDLHVRFLKAYNKYEGLTDGFMNIWLVSSTMQSLESAKRRDGL